MTKYIDSIEHKDSTKWPLAKIHSFLHKFHALTGRMNWDGDIFPGVTEPILVKKEIFKKTQSSGTPVAVTPALGEWLGVADADLKNYRIDCYLIPRVASVADQVDLSLDTASGSDQNYRTTNAGTVGQTLTPVSFWPQNAADHIDMDFDWTVGNLYAIIAVLAYRMPDAICVR